MAESTREPSQVDAVNPRLVEPRFALQDYRNEANDLLILYGCSGDRFSKVLRMLTDSKGGLVMFGFSQKFPPDVCPDAPADVVARLDTIAAEMNTLYLAGKLTRGRVLSMEAEVTTLCR